MHEGRGLEGLTGLLLSELPCRKTPELPVDQRQELLGRLRVALLDGRQNTGHVDALRRRRRECFVELLGAHTRPPHGRESAFGRRPAVPHGCPAAFNPAEE